MRYVVIVLALLALAGCVPTPKPFAHDGADDQAYRPKDDKVEVSIAPPKNMPPQLGGRVAAALAIELQSYGIVATVAPAKAPALVTGVMSTRDAPTGGGIQVEVEWSLSSGKGTEGPLSSKTFVRGEDYVNATDRLVSRIAQQAAPQVSTLMGRPPDYEARSLGQVAAGLSIPPAPPSPTDADAVNPGATTASAATSAAAAKPTAPSAASPPQVKVMVAAVTGAPSDGNRQLFSGMRRALGSSKIVIMDKGGEDVFTVTGTVSLTPIDDRSAQLSVTWRLKDPSGKDVGKVEQSNPVPVAATRGTWAGFGDIVADAAVEGILELLDKALSKPR
ncbi:hypothetical protein SAMN02745126_02699 [Enhydrobacter aerosaccus]|uniref:Lipoprotein n=1 Tax=Enhydrobacter aerosaccus TaxID=225324 RepID=A0A1T4PAC4_9HYPH|nr:hypothetical protein [Enhydrobacter aerosaccus]SJZ88484.1 hypothetical protein SAMN02745126_02699 [Enhydrobacter aerosaccus]